MKQHAEKITSAPTMFKKDRYRPLRCTADPDSQEEKNFALHAINDAPEAKKKMPVIKRFSPFLILACLLLVLFPYLMITQNGSIQNFWLLLFLFPFTISNLLFADFAIWKYFSGKKVMPIWLIELTLSIFIVQLLI
ncbi:hypothetical protein BH10BAC2_BH10BAC2_04820 [soil metagenome]